MAIEKEEAQIMIIQQPTVVMLGLKQAAAMCLITPQELARKTRLGIVPGSKVGRRWVFIESDLVEHIRSQYNKYRRVPLDDGGSVCRYSDGGFKTVGAQKRELDSVLDRILAPKSKDQRRTA